MRTYELEPCPCCGGPGKLKDIHNKIRQGWVGCPACGLYINWKISPDGAIRKWNKRAFRPVLKCKDCKWWTKQSFNSQGRCALFGIYPTGGWYCANAKAEEVIA